MPAPHTIGLVAPGWTPDLGPAATLGEALSRTLLAAGLEPQVFAGEQDARRRPYSVRDERVGGVHVRRVNLPCHGPLAVRDLESDPRIEALVRTWIPDRSIDLLHVMDGGPFGLGAMQAGERAGRPTVVNLFDLAILCPRRHMQDSEGRVCSAPHAQRCSTCLAATYLRVSPTDDDCARRTSRALACLRGASAVLLPSEEAIEHLVRAGLRRSDLILCPPGVETQTLALETSLARRGLSGGRRIGVLGTVRPSSGVLELAHALCLADRPGLTLEVHGALADFHGDATYVNALRRMAELDPRVRLHGPYPRHELPRVLATLDAVAAPDRWDVTTALAVREARAAGLTVLASSRGVHCELADDPGVVLVDGTGLDAWVAALRGLDLVSTRPAPLRSLLSMAEQVLAVYRRAAKCGPVPATPKRSNSQPSGPRTSDAPRPPSS